MEAVDLSKSYYIVITDIGSTTTKALLITNKSGSYRFAGEFETPTTVEKPAEDVKIGVMKAVKGLERMTGVKNSPANL